MSERVALKAPGWLFCLAVIAAWLLGAELAVFTAIGRSLPDRVPGLAVWTVVVLSVAFLAVTGRREIINGRQTSHLIVQLKEALGSFGMLTATSLGSLPPDELLEQLLQRLNDVLETDVAAVLLSDDGCAFAFRAAAGLDVAHLGSFGVAAGQGLIGGVAASRAPEAVEHGGHLDLLTSQLHYPVGSAAACPIVVQGRLLGVCVVGTSSARRFDERRLQLLQLVADRAGAEIERAALNEAQRRSRVDAEQARRRVQMLANASQVLLTARDDYKESLVALGGVVVPDFGDWCSIEIADRAGQNQTVAVARRDRAGLGGCCSGSSHDLEAGEAALCLRFPSLPDMRAAVLVSGAPQLSDDRRIIVVPIDVGGSVFATMVVAAEDSRPVYEPPDVITAIGLAERAAIAVERVLRYRDARAAAQAARRRAAQLHQLLRASIDVQQVRNSSEVLARMAERSRQVFDAQTAVVTADVASVGTLQAVAQANHDTVVDRPRRLEAIDPDLLVPPDRKGALGEWRAAPVLGHVGTTGGTVAVRTVGSELSEDDEAVLVLLAQMTSTALDSTERYRTIRANEARWRVLVEAAPVGIIEVDLLGKVVWWNRAATVLFGWPDVLARSLDDKSGDREGVDPAPSFAQGTAVRFQALWSEVVQSLEVIDREVHATPVAGELCDLAVSAAPLYSPDGDIHGILTLVADVTDRRRLEAELGRAQRMEAVGQLAGGVAHDFNNLLTLITGYSELLERHLETDRRSVELVDGIRAATARAGLLTGQLLTISKRQQAHRVVVDPGQCLRSLAEVLQRILGPRVSLTWALDPQAGHVSIDPGQLEQVILNLATNARDAMPEGGHLNVSVVSLTLDGGRAAALGIGTGRYLCISVCDSGSGMDTATKARCFEPLFTTKGPSHGTGIGLSAVRQVVDESGGAVHVDSCVGQGTTFRVYLPAVDQTARVSGRTEETAPAAVETGKARTILVAEDDEALRNIMTRALRRDGYRVLEASDGCQAVVQAERWSGTIDAMISDVVMPGMTGPGVAATLKSSRPAMRVLFVSGGTDGSVLAAMPPDPLSFLAKPFQPSQLLARVGELLDG